MEILTGAALFGAAFAAGAINAVAGGGSLVSFPALVAAGYSTKAANVTNSVALWPGYLGGTFGYRAEVASQRTHVLALTLPSIAGALLESDYLGKIAAAGFHDITSVTSEYPDGRGIASAAIVAFKR